MKSAVNKRVTEIKLKNGMASISKLQVFENG
jgi:hypothetical protein